MPLLSLSVTQLLLAFVSASILHKLTFNRFFLKWLASHKFSCFSEPKNNVLKSLKDKTNDYTPGKKGSTKQKNRSKKDASSRHDGQSDEVFKIPTANLDFLELEKFVISVRDLELITYSVDLEWIVDLALMSLFSFTITQIQFYFYPESDEYNFSLLWAFIVIIYCVRILGKLTGTYFKYEQSIGESSICIISGCTFLLLAMVILIANEDHLELGLESAYRSFNESATAYVNNHTLLSDKSRPTTKPISFILVKFSIAIICSLVGVVFTFPGLRFGQLQKSLINQPDTGCLYHLILNLNYLAPLFIVCLWIKPMSRRLVTNQDLFPIDDATFDTIRIYLIIITSIFRFHLLPRYVAIFLVSAENRITRIKHRGGTITNREVRLIVSSIYNYVNVVTIQYILPILMCLFAAVMLKATGGYDWPSTNFNNTDPIKTINSTGIIKGVLEEGSANYNEFSNETKFSSISTMVDLREIKKIFSADVFRGIFGFATWWIHFSWFCTSTAGVIYHTYFLH